MPVEEERRAGIFDAAEEPDRVDFFFAAAPRALDFAVEEDLRDDEAPGLLAVVFEDARAALLPAGFLVAFFLPRELFDFVLVAVLPAFLLPFLLPALPADLLPALADIFFLATSSPPLPADAGARIIQFR